MNRERTVYMQSFYGAVASRYDRFMDLLYRNRDEEWRRAALESVDGADHVLEVGAGTCRTETLSHDMDLYISTDISRSMLSSAEIAEAPVQSDVHTLPFRNDRFDAVIAVLLMSTRINHQTALKEMQRVVHPDGNIVLIDKFSSSTQHQRLLDQVKTLLTYPFAFDFDVDIEQLSRDCNLTIHERTDVPDNMGMIEKVILR